MTTPACRILVVEDEALLAEELRDRLTDAGHVVVDVVDTGPDAIAAARRDRPDLVLMDIRLKGPMEGIEAAELIYRDLDIPIVFATAHSDQPTLARVRSVALFGYVLKPLRMNDLIASINVALERHRGHQQAQEALRDREELFRVAFEGASVGVSVVSMDGRFARANQALCDMLGYTSAELRGRSFNDVTHPDDATIGMQFVAEARAGRSRASTFEKRYLHALGHVVWVRVSASMMEGTPDRPGLFIAYIEDISSHKAAEAERLRLVADLSARVQELTLLHQVGRLLNTGRPLDGALLRDLATLIQAGCDAPSLCEARIVLGPDVGATAGWRDGAVRAAARFALGDGEPGQIEVAYRGGVGATTATPEMDNLLQLIADKVRAHADRQRDEAAIRRLNRVQALRSDVNQLIIRGGPDSMLEAACQVAVERGGFRMVWIGAPDLERGGATPIASAGVVDGYLDAFTVVASPDELRAGPTGRCVSSGRYAVCSDIATDPRFSPWRDAALLRGYRSSASFPLVVGGRLVAVLNLYAAEPGFFDERELRVLDEIAGDIAFALEVREREALQLREAESLRAIDRQFASAFANAPIGMALIAPGGRWLRVNAALCAITGYSSDELVARTVQDITHLDDLTDDDVLLEELHQGLRTAYQREKRYLRRDGTEVWVQVNVSLVRDDQGAPVHRIAQIQNLTDRRQMEDELRQRQKLEGIAMLAGGVAHDFNNMLAVILTSVDLALSEVPPPFVHECLASVQDAAERAAQLTRQLLAFGRRQVLKPAVIDVARVVCGMEQMLRSLLRDDIELQLPDARASGKVFADHGQLTQILLNLGVNARDAMPAGGRLAIDVSTTTLPADHERPAGDHVVLRVTDTGVGMAPDVLPHIFEPFFTTKEVGKGTGLGLATVFGIVQQSGGRIAVTSEAGRGTSFTIHLPRTDRDVDAPREVVHTGTLDGDETLLVVDDDPQVRAMLRTILTRHGYVVLVAESAGDALLVSEQHPGAIDLLVSDVVMPRMTGPQLVQRLAPQRPEMAVLLCSGYAAELAAGDDPAAMGHAFLAKPFRTDELLRAVRDLLDARASTLARARP